MSVKEKKHRLNILISESMHKQLSEVVERHDELKSDFVRRAVERELERRKKEDLERTAAELAPIYESDEELIVFTTLDGENFL